MSDATTDVRTAIADAIGWGAELQNAEGEGHDQLLARLRVIAEGGQS